MKPARPARSSSALVEFKGTALRVVSARLRTLDPDRLAQALESLLGESPDFFCGEPAILDCTAAEPAKAAQWQALCAMLRRYRLNPIGVRTPSSELQESARADGLIVLEAEDRRSRSQADESPPETRPAPQPAPPKASPGTGGETLVIDRPLRSGQQVYARGADLVVLAMVNTGAEVVADGNIHVYAPLRGRALAGASGNTAARIFTTCMEAELVSIAGVYRMLEAGPPPELARRPAQVRYWVDEPARQSGLAIEPLSIG